jgi:transcription initiation factor IIF auxiliary subunit
MEIRQSAKYAGNDWWDWSVWLEGTDAALDAVSYVEWRLHPTFPDPVRRVTNRQSKFRLDTGGWGTFVIQSVIYMKTGSPERLRHELQLQYPDETPARA